MQIGQSVKDLEKGPSNLETPLEFPSGGYMNIVANYIWLFLLVAGVCALIIETHRNSESTNLSYVHLLYALGAAAALCLMELSDAPKRVVFNEEAIVCFTNCGDLKTRKYSSVHGFFPIEGECQKLRYCWFNRGAMIPGLSVTIRFIGCTQCLSITAPLNRREELLRTLALKCPNARAPPTSYAY